MTSKYPIPFNDEHRIAVLRSFGLLDSDPEPLFDSMAQLVCRHFGTPIALVSLVDKDRQWFKARAGIDAQETPRDQAFCAHAIMEPDVLVILDASRDPRFADNPLVTKEPKIRFYAGAPLVTDGGFKLGTLCVIDTLPRTRFSHQEVADLRAFADLVMERLEARRVSLAAAANATENEAALAAIEDVVVHLAHEVRTPLAAIVGFADLIGQSALGPDCGPEYREKGREIAEIGCYLGDLAQRTLDAARLKSGEVALKEQWIPLAALQDGILTMLPELTADGSPVLLSDLGEAPHSLYADGIRLRQMLVNLLVNALRHTPADGRIAVSCARAENGALDLTVSDTGPGMTESQIALALLPFGRVAQDLATKDAGFGLGLPLVRKLIELHGGRLLVDSAVGRGTDFTLRFPAYRARPRSDGETAD